MWTISTRIRDVNDVNAMININIVFELVKWGSMLRVQTEREMNVLLRNQKSECNGNVDWRAFN